MSNHYYLREILSYNERTHRKSLAEHNTHFRNVHFLMDFGPWNAGEYVEHLFIDYHTETMRQLSNGGLCIRACKINVTANNMIRAAQNKTHEHTDGLYYNYKAEAPTPVKDGVLTGASDPGELPITLHIEELKRTNLSKDDVLVVTFPQHTDEHGLTEGADTLRLLFGCKVLAKRPDMKVEPISTGNQSEAIGPDDETDTLTPTEQTKLDIESLAKQVRMTYEEAHQTTMDLVNGLVATAVSQKLEEQDMPEEDPKNGRYLTTDEILNGGLRPGTLLEGISKRGPRDAVVCARHLTTIDDKPTYLYVVRTFVWGNLCRLTAAEVASQFRVTSRTHPTDLIPAWVLVRHNEDHAKMEYTW